MKFLLYTTTYGKSGSIQLHRPGFWVPALLGICTLLSGVGSLGYKLGAGQTPLAAQNPADQGLHWQVALNEQKQELVQARDAAQDELNALAVRLGQMQAQMLRIEALGQRLAQAANLDNSEFDFDQLPARGGPAEPVAEEQTNGIDFLRNLDDLALQLDDRARQLEVLERVVSQRQLKHAMSPAGRPVSKGWLSSYFGKRTDPFSGHREMHKGVDFAGQMGSDIVSTAAGVVTWAGKRYGYGNLVEINHGNGLSTRYGHCKEILVKVGDKVAQGQTIGLMGSTGRSTGPHVHYEVLKNGRQVNPAKYVRAQRRTTG
jgi:murein DD-endopeptidase MepM/ murein hydrolase activator NlpD